MQKYNKAIVAIVLGAVFVALSQYGITEETTLKQALEAALIALSVYLVPNKS